MNVMHLKVIVFGGGHIGLQRFVHVQSNVQPLPTKLIVACFDRSSYVCATMYIYIYMYSVVIISYVCI